MMAREPSLSIIPTGTNFYSIDSIVLETITQVVGCFGGINHVEGWETILVVVIDESDYSDDDDDRRRDRLDVPLLVLETQTSLQSTRQQGIVQTGWAFKVFNSSWNGSVAVKTRR